MDNLSVYISSWNVGFALSGSSAARSGKEGLPHANDSGVHLSSRQSDICAIEILRCKRTFLKFNFMTDFVETSFDRVIYNLATIDLDEDLRNRFDVIAKGHDDVKMLLYFPAHEQC